MYRSINTPVPSVYWFSIDLRKREIIPYVKEQAHKLETAFHAKQESVTLIKRVTEMGQERSVQFKWEDISEDRQTPTMWQWTNTHGQTQVGKRSVGRVDFSTGAETFHVYVDQHLYIVPESDNKGKFIIQKSEINHQHLILPGHDLAHQPTQEMIDNGIGKLGLKPKEIKMS